MKDFTVIVGAPSAENKNTARVPDVVFNLGQLRLGSVPRLRKADPFSEAHLNPPLLKKFSFRT